MSLVGLLLLFTLSLSSCGNKNKASEMTKETVATIQVPQFDADSAYQYVKEQVDFGPRVPNSKGHVACGNYLAGQLEKFGATVTNQYADLIAYDGTLLKARNIIGSYKPENKKRIALFAHWDTRPWADNDPDKKNHYTPILGANDGASGVGALLEIARQIGMKAPETGVDIIFFDAEDYGTPEFAKDRYNDTSDTWCLGSRFWGKNPHKPGYKAEFGILLDMVGAKDAVFYKEYISMKYAARYVDEVWEAARNLGYGKYFINANGGGVTDDHEAVIEETGIPCLDIINYDPNSDKGFRDHWHTQNDNMSNIDKNVLKAVGQTVTDKR